MMWFVWLVRKPRSGPEPTERTIGIDWRELRFLVLLIGAVVVWHAVTLSNIVPWQSWYLWERPEPAKTVHIGVADYKFKLPEKPVRVPKGKFVEFVLTSEDVTYGFGVFRKDGTLVFQIQVLPGYKNKIVWNFTEPGFYDVRSTEYSGPRHPEMLVPDAILVQEQ